MILLPVHCEDALFCFTPGGTHPSLSPLAKTYVVSKSPASVRVMYKIAYTYSS